MPDLDGVYDRVMYIYTAFSNAIHGVEMTCIDSISFGARVTEIEELSFADIVGMSRQKRPRTVDRYQ